MSARCRICDGTRQQTVELRWRHTLDDLREYMCAGCQMYLAVFMGWLEDKRAAS